MTGQKYIVIDSEALINPDYSTVKLNELDVVRQNKRHYHYGQAYLRMLSDLTNKTDYKLVLVSQYQSGKLASDLEELFKLCHHYNIPQPKISARVFHHKMPVIDPFAELNHSGDRASLLQEPKEIAAHRDLMKSQFPVITLLRSQHTDLKALLENRLGHSLNDSFVFCDNVLAYPGCNAKANQKWTGKAFYESLKNIYFNAAMSPEKVFSRLAQYGEFFVDKTNAGEASYVWGNGAGNLTPDVVMAAIDRIARSPELGQANDWPALDLMQTCLSGQSPIIRGDLVMQVDEKRLIQHQSKGWQQGHYNRKRQTLAKMMDNLLPAYQKRLNEVSQMIEQRKQHCDKHGFVMTELSMMTLQRKVDEARLWFSQHYNSSNDPYIKLFGLIECMNACHLAVKEAREADNEDEADSKQFWQRLGLLILASLLVIPMLIYIGHYAKQRSKDKQYHFFPHPQNAVISTCRHAEREVLSPMQVYAN